MTMKSPEEIADRCLHEDGRCRLGFDQRYQIATAIRSERERAEKAERERDELWVVLKKLADLRVEWLDMVKGKIRTSLDAHNQHINFAYDDLFAALRAGAKGRNRSANAGRKAGDFGCADS